MWLVLQSSLDSLTSEAVDLFWVLYDAVGLLLNLFPEGYGNLVVGIFLLYALKEVSCKQQTAQPTRRKKSNPGQVYIFNVMDIRNRPDLSANKKDREKDINRLKNAYKSSEANVTEIANPTFNRIFKKLEDLKEQERRPPFIGLYFLSHGYSENGHSYFVTSDDKKIYVNTIREEFSNQEAPRLKYMPIHIVFEACRGGKREEIRRNVTENHYTYSNLLLFFSSQLGYVSYGGSEDGSKFIKLIEKVFTEHCENLDLRKMFDLVAEKLPCDPTYLTVNNVLRPFVQRPELEPLGFHQQFIGRKNFGYRRPHYQHRRQQA